MIIGNVVVADWFLWIVVGVFFFALSGGLYWVYTARLKRGFKAVAVTYVEGMPEVMGEREFKKGDVEKGVKMFGKIFTPVLTKPHHRKYGWTYYFFNFADQSLLTMDGKCESISDADRQKYLNDGVFKRAFGGLGFGGDLLLVVIVMIGLAVMAGVMGYFVYPSLHPLGNSTVFTP